MSDFPQKAMPASERQINAQVKQAEKELANTPNWIHDKRLGIWTWHSPNGLYVVSEWEDAIFFPDGTARHDCDETTETLKMECERHFFVIQ